MKSRTLPQSSLGLWSNLEAKKHYCWCNTKAPCDPRLDGTAHSLLATAIAYFSVESRPVCTLSALFDMLFMTLLALPT